MKRRWQAGRVLLFGLMLGLAALSLGMDNSAGPTLFLPLVARSATQQPAPMILVLAGGFDMGCHSGQASCLPDALPLHMVYLDSYLIDKYEVTNARYQACVDTGGCTPPHDLSSITHDPYYGSAAYANYPVMNVDWQQAKAFCLWEGKRLPTEAEWEKAARGWTDQRVYPWGDVAPACSRVNANLGGYCVGDAAAVGSYPAGASPYGVMDMAGNLSEWVLDWYGRDYYRVSPMPDPPGPATGVNRVVRGGSWDLDDWYLPVSFRVPVAPDTWTPHRGFRCARSEYGGE